MKMKFALLASIALLSGLTACSAPGAMETVSDMGETNSSPSTTAEPVKASDSDGGTAPIVAHSGVNSNAQFISENANLYQNGLLYTRVDSDKPVSYFLDLDTMNTAPLCAVPNCTHKTDDCLARQLGMGPLLYGDYIYYFEAEADVRETTNGTEFYMESALKKASLDSSETQTVSEFTDAVPRDGQGYILDGNELYFIAYDPDPYEDGYGGYGWGSAGGRDYLCSINLDSGAYQNYGEICYVEDEYPSADSTASATILGFYNGKVYIGYSFVKDYSDEMENLEWTLYNFEFDLTTKTLTESTLPYPSWMDEDSYVSYTDEEHFTVIGQGQTYELEGYVNEVNAPVYNGKVFGWDSWFDLSDQSEHSLGKYAVSDEAYWQCIAYYDGYYIFTDYNDFEKVSEEELMAL